MHATPGHAATLARTLAHYTQNQLGAAAELEQKRRHAGALAIYEELSAKFNHPDSGYRAGLKHLYGLGTEENPKAALAFFEIAGSRGHVLAQYMAGELHAYGVRAPGRILADAVPRNLNAGINWYRKAARQGHRLSKHRLCALGIPGHEVTVGPGNHLTAEGRPDRTNPAAAAMACSPRVPVSRPMAVPL